MNKDDQIETPIVQKWHQIAVAFFGSLSYFAHGHSFSKSAFLIPRLQVGIVKNYIANPKTKCYLLRMNLKNLTHTLNCHLKKDRGSPQLC